jgi:hypothetical protein
MAVCVALVDIDPRESLATDLADVLAAVEVCPDMPCQVFWPCVFAATRGALVEVAALRIVSGCGRLGM